MASCFNSPGISFMEEKDTPDSPGLQKQIFYYQNPLVWPIKYSTRKQPTPWSQEEDDYLKQLVSQQGVKQWKRITLIMFNLFNIDRSAEQISQHWFRVLNPDITKGKWSQEEDKQLLDAVRICSPKQWKHIANHLQGRSDIQVRYRLERLKKYLIKNSIIESQYLP